MFRDEFKAEADDFSILVEKVEKVVIVEGTIEEVIDAGIKIKSTTPLPGKNGTIYEFYNTRDTKEANKILDGKLDGNTVYVK